MQPTNRDHGIDLLRSFGVLAIVAGHVWTPQQTAFLYAWHVPVFFFLTGWLWTPHRHLREEFRRRAESLLKPYSCWLGVLLLLVILLNHPRPIIFAKVIYGGFYAKRPFTTFWFVCVLFVSAILWRLLGKAPVWVRAVLVAVSVGGAYLAGPILSRTPLAMGSAFPSLVFIAAGQVARQATIRFALGFLSGTLFSMSGTVLFFLGVQPFNMKAGDWGTPVLSLAMAILLSWGFLLLASRIMTVAGPTAGTIATGFALSGFTVVLAHPGVLAILNAQNGSLLIFILCVSFPTIIGQVALHTPASQWVTGALRLPLQNRGARPVGRRGVTSIPRHTKCPDRDPQYGAEHSRRANERSDLDD